MRQRAILGPNRSGNLAGQGEGDTVGARFDDLARGFASGDLSRRGLLRGAVAGALGLWLGETLLTPGRAVATPGSPCALQTYGAGTSFTGQAIQADVQFFPALADIDACGVANSVRVVVTSSYRPGGTIPKNAVV